MNKLTFQEESYKLGSYWSSKEPGCGNIEDLLQCMHVHLAQEVPPVNKCIKNVQI